jgi:hypothetical protein
MAQITLNSSGVASNGSLLLQSNGTTTAVTIDTSQNVGLGVTPSAWALSGAPALQIKNAGFVGYLNNAYVSANQYFTVSGNSTYIANGFATVYTQTTGQHQWSVAASGTAGGSISFNQAMTLDASGNLGVGATSPNHKIEASSSTNNYIGVTCTTDGNAASRFRNNQRDWLVGVLGGASGAWAVYDTTAGAERARIDSSGNLLVGLTSQTSTAAVFAVSSSKNNGNAARIGLMSIGGTSGGGGYPQVGYNTAFTSTTTINYLSSDFASWVRFESGKVETFTAASGTSGNAISPTTGPYVAQGGTSWTNSSDERLKDIIEPITDATNKVGQLRAVIGKFKTDPEDKRRSFLLAQDVQSVLPEAVDASDPESLGVQYTDVIPLLVAAIKEQQALITTLTDRITALEAK